MITEDEADKFSNGMPKKSVSSGKLYMDLWKYHYKDSSLFPGFRSGWHVEVFRAPLSYVAGSTWVISCIYRPWLWLQKSITVNRLRDKGGGYIFYTMASSRFGYVFPPLIIKIILQLWFSFCHVKNHPSTCAWVTWLWSLSNKEQMDESLLSVHCDPPSGSVIEPPVNPWRI